MKNVITKSVTISANDATRRNRRVTFKEDVQDKKTKGRTSRMTFTNTRKLIHHLKLTMMKKADSDSENETSDKIEDLE